MMAPPVVDDWIVAPHDATIDRTIVRLVPRLIVLSVVGRNDRSHDACDRSLHPTIDLRLKVGYHY